MKRYEAPHKDPIAGVRVKDVKLISDERGRLMEILRNDEDLFQKFGQVYMTTNYPGVVKAWHYHKVQCDNVVCVKGMIKLALFDNRDGSPTKGRLNEFFLGDHNNKLVHIPAGVWHGWKCVSVEEAFIVNTVTHPYNPDEPDEFRLDAHDKTIPWDWSTTDF